MQQEGVLEMAPALVPDVEVRLAELERLGLRLPLLSGAI